MRVVVCGSRYAELTTEYVSVAKVLNALHAETPFTLVMHGACRGIDAFADDWAKRAGIPVKAYPADWYKHDRAAGPIRNQEMVDAKPDLVVSFDGGRGTADMLARARKAEIPVREYRKRFSWVEIKRPVGEAHPAVSDRVA